MLFNTFKILWVIGFLVPISFGFVHEVRIPEFSPNLLIMCSYFGYFFGYKFYSNSWLFYEPAAPVVQVLLFNLFSLVV